MLLCSVKAFSLRVRVWVQMSFLCKDTGGFVEGPTLFQQNLVLTKGTFPGPISSLRPCSEALGLGRWLLFNSSTPNNTLLFSPSLTPF